MPLNPNDFPNLTPWIYGRNSQDKNKGLSVPAQLEWGRAVCKRFGWTDARESTDPDIGATRYTLKERPGYLELTAGLAEPAPEGTRWVLVTRSSSRANRQLLDFALLRETCAQLGVLWYSGGQLYDMDNPHDRRSLASEAVDNEYQPEQNRFDSMQQLRQNFLDGKPHGREAFGYRIVYERGTAVGRVPDEVTAPVVREMVRRVLAAESVTSITRWLASEAVPTPAAELALPCRKCSDTNGRRVLRAVDRRTCGCDKSWKTKWDHTTVRKVVSTPAIAGLRTHTDPKTGEVSTTKAAWPALITVEQHEEVTALLTDPRRRSSQRGNTPRWLLTGIPRCGKCLEGRMFSRTAGGTRTRSYDCRNYCVSRGADLVDAFVEEAVLQRLENPTLLAALERTDAEAVAAAAEAKQLRASYDKWIAEAIDAELSPIEIKQYKDRRLPAILAADARAQAALPMPHVVAAAGPNARAKWADESVTPLTAKRDIIRSLLDITILPVKKRHGFGAPVGAETIEIRPLVG